MPAALRWCGRGGCRSSHMKSTPQPNWGNVFGRKKAEVWNKISAVCPKQAKGKYKYVCRGEVHRYLKAKFEESWPLDLRSVQNWMITSSMLFQKCRCPYYSICHACLVMCVVSWGKVGRHHQASEVEEARWLKASDEDKPIRSSMAAHPVSKPKCKMMCTQHIYRHGLSQLPIDRRKGMACEYSTLNNGGVRQEMLSYRRWIKLNKSSVLVRVKPAHEWGE